MYFTFPDFAFPVNFPDCHTTTAEIQKLQNHALRLCLRYNLADRITIRQLHSEAKLQSIEHRCEYQILKLLYGYSRIAANVKTPTRQT